MARKPPRSVEVQAEARVILHRWQQAMAKTEADIAEAITIGYTILEDALHHEGALQAYDYEVQLAMLDNRLITPGQAPPELRSEHIEALQHFRNQE